MHPKYLDSIGLVALWREALLALKVLEGKTRGYKNHPQLIRFKELNNSQEVLNTYLYNVYSEGAARGFKFNKNKLRNNFTDDKIFINSGQISYEFDHLLKKLKSRNFEMYKKIKNHNNIDANNIFVVRMGDVESWERV